MSKLKIVCMLTTLLLCFGCAKVKEDEKFIGVWSNNISPGLGDIQLTISRDGDKLLVKEKFISLGKDFAMHSAKVENGYLQIDGDGAYAKMSYSETEDSLLPVNKGFSLPGFHRVK